MINLLFEGGILFMSLLTISFATAIAIATSCFIKKEISSQRMDLVKSIGLFAFVLGLLGQFIGLYSALEAIAGFKDGISPSILAEGLRVSSISSIYGMIIFVTSYLLWFVLNARADKS